MMRLLPLLLLAACASAPTPVVCHCEREAPKADVSRLLAPCPVAMPKDGTLNEAIRVANLRFKALLQCNADKAALRQQLH